LPKLLSFLSAIISLFILNESLALFIIGASDVPAEVLLVGLGEEIVLELFDLLILRLNRLLDVEIWVGLPPRLVELDAVLVVALPQKIICTRRSCRRLGVSTLIC